MIISFIFLTIFVSVFVFIFSYKDSKGSTKNSTNILYSLLNFIIWPILGIFRLIEITYDYIKNIHSITEKIAVILVLLWYINLLTILIMYF